MVSISKNISHLKGNVIGDRINNDHLNRLMQMRMHSGFDNITWNKSSILTAYEETLATMPMATY